MKSFLQSNFLLDSVIAKRLYDQHASQMPIIDFYSLLDVEAIALDQQYQTISDLFFGTDLLKWQLMRCHGIPESRITAFQTGDPYETFLAFAETLPHCIGHPLYHWTHLELQRYFGILTTLSPETASMIYDRCNIMLEDERMSLRGLLHQSRVEVLCSVDDPADDLGHHHTLAADSTCHIQVLPTFCPDRALHPNASDFPDYLEELSCVEGIGMDSYEAFQAVFTLRMEYFAVAGCRTSVHHLDAPVCEPISEQIVSQIFIKAKHAIPLTPLEVAQFQTSLLLFLAKEYHRLGWVMQLHYGGTRTLSLNPSAPPTPSDARHGVFRAFDGAALSDLLHQMQASRGLPNLLVSSHNQHDHQMIAAIAGDFQVNASPLGRIQLGSTWWLHDTKSAIEQQLSAVSQLGILGNHIGMSTHSSCVLSYSRQEYFRRILCSYLGGFVDRGEYPADLPAVGAMVEDICYDNVKKFFSFQHNTT